MDNLFAILIFSALFFGLIWLDSSQETEVSICTSTQTGEIFFVGKRSDYDLARKTITELDKYSCRTDKMNKGDWYVLKNTLKLRTAR